MGPRGHSLITWLAPALLAAILSLFGWPAVALAHAGLIRSSPAANAELATPPSRIILHFSEPPEVNLSVVTVVDRNGKPSPAAGTLTVEPSDPSTLLLPMQPLDNGIYTVTYRVTSAIDGHVNRGSIAFVLGADVVKPGELQTMYGDISANSYQTDVPLAAAHWLGYIAIAMLLGGIAFYPAVLLPAVQEATVASGGAGGNAASIGRAAGPEPSLPFAVLYLALAAAIAAAVAGAVLQAATSASTDLAGALGTPLNNLLRGTRYGALLWLKVTLLAALGVLLLVGQAQPSRRPLPGWWLACSLALGAAVLALVSLGSHAVGPNEPGLSLLADWLHLTSVSLWGGGLVALALSLQSVRRLPGEVTAWLVERLAARFTILAGSAVLVIGLTGTYRAWHEVADPNNLPDTTYGQALALKLALLLPVLGLAGLNLVIERRHLPGSRAERWTGRLQRAVAGEALLLATVLAATAWLTGLPPARDAFGAGIVARNWSSNIGTVLVVTPGVVGGNTFELYLRDEWHRPLVGAEKVALLLTPPERGLGTHEVVLDEGSDGRYAAEGTYLSVPGAWKAQVLVRLAGREDVRLDYLLSPALH